MGPVRPIILVVPFGKNLVHIWPLYLSIESKVMTVNILITVTFLFRETLFKGFSTKLKVPGKWLTSQYGVNKFRPANKCAGGHLGN